MVFEESACSSILDPASGRLLVLLLLEPMEVMSPMPLETEAEPWVPLVQVN